MLDAAGGARRVDAMPKAKPAARITDRTQHGGALVTGSLSVSVEGLPAARLADAHVCPEHGGGVVVEVGTFPRSAALPAARQGDLVACPVGPHQIAGGASRTSFGTNVHIGGLSSPAPGGDAPAPAAPPSTAPGGGAPLPFGEDLRQIIYQAADDLMRHPKVTAPPEMDAPGGKKAIPIRGPSDFLGVARHLHDNPGLRPVGSDLPASQTHRWQKYLVGPLNAQANENQLRGTLNSLVSGVGKYSEISGQMDRFRQALMRSKIPAFLHDRAISQAFEQFFQDGSFPPFVTGSKDRSNLFARLLVLFNRETIRNPATAAYLPIMLRQVSTGKMTWDAAFAAFEGTDTFGGRGEFPMSMTGAQAASVRPRGPPEGSAKERQNQEAGRSELDRRETALADPWVHGEVEKEMATQGIKSFATPQQASGFTRQVVKKRLNEFYNLGDEAP